MKELLTACPKRTTDSITRWSSRRDGTARWLQIPRDRETAQELGLTFHRQAAGSHEIWFNESLRRYTTIPNHPGDTPEGTLRAILRQAGVEVNEFLDEKPEASDEPSEA